MKRREFIKWVGVGAIASYLPVALAACTANKTANSDSTPEELSLGTTEQLETEGYLLNESAKVMVVKNSQGELIAVNPTCTHQGCIVGWEKDSNTLVCPCHNAQFTPDGTVLAKPASESLSTYEVTIKAKEVINFFS